MAGRNTGDEILVPALVVEIVFRERPEPLAESLLHLRVHVGQGSTVGLVREQGNALLRGRLVELLPGRVAAHHEIHRTKEIGAYPGILHRANVRPPGAMFIGPLQDLPMIIGARGGSGKKAENDGDIEIE